MYIADCGNNRIRKVVLSTGIITTFAGTGSQGYTGDGEQATSATLYEPQDVVVDTAGIPLLMHSSVLSDSIHLLLRQRVYRRVL